MASSQRLQLRWVWLSLYIISGCLFLAYVAFAAMDALPGGVFYMGFGGAGFVGAIVASAHSGGANVAETSIAAVLVGILHLGLLVFQVEPGTAAIIPRLAEPLSTIFVCFAGAFAGGQLGSRGQGLAQAQESMPRLAATALLVLIGAIASHVTALVVLGGICASPTLILGVFLFFTTPAIAGYALQRSTGRDVTSAFLFGIATAGLAILALLVLLPTAYDWNLVWKGILFMFLFIVTGGFTLVLVLPGILIAQTSEARQTQRRTRLPRACIRFAPNCSPKPTSLQ
ncbi:MAG: hypothetical protein GY811_27580 [Myxococcales bacterium]|nr:hypothetical protein [Myxococcales bacterium]